MTVTESDTLKHRKSPKESCLQKVSAEQKEYAEACASPRMTETDITSANEQTERLLGKILDPGNLNKAYKQVVRNKGAGGVDGMTVEQLLPYLKAHKEELLQSIWDGSYRPKPVRRVEIPKENGKTRKLGIPTVIDRLIQQAISQVLSPIFELQFSDNSFGFRPKRSAHDALKKVSIQHYRRLYLCCGHGFGEILRHGEPKQTRPDPLGNDQGWSGNLPYS